MTLPVMVLSILSKLPHATHNKLCTVLIFVRPGIAPNPAAFAPAHGAQALMQVWPALDGVHCFILHDFLQQACWGGVPADGLQLQQAYTEPCRQ